MLLPLLLYCSGFSTALYLPKDDFLMEEHTDASVIENSKEKLNSIPGFPEVKEHQAITTNSPAKTVDDQLRFMERLRKMALNNGMMSMGSSSRQESLHQMPGSLETSQWNMKDLPKLGEATEETAEEPTVQPADLSNDVKTEVSTEQNELEGKKSGKDLDPSPSLSSDQEEVPQNPEETHVSEPEQLQKDVHEEEKPEVTDQKLVEAVDQAVDQAAENLRNNVDNRVDAQTPQHDDTQLRSEDKEHHPETGKPDTEHSPPVPIDWKSIEDIFQNSSTGQDTKDAKEPKPTVDPFESPDAEHEEDSAIVQPTTATMVPTHEETTVPATTEEPVPVVAIETTPMEDLVPQSESTVIQEPTSVTSKPTEQLQPTEPSYALPPMPISDLPEEEDQNPSFLEITTVSPEVEVEELAKVDEEQNENIIAKFKAEVSVMITENKTDYASWKGSLILGQNTLEVFDNDEVNEYVLRRIFFWLSLIRTNGDTPTTRSTVITQIYHIAACIFRICEGVFEQPLHSTQIPITSEADIPRIRRGACECKKPIRIHQVLAVMERIHSIRVEQGLYSS